MEKITVREWLTSTGDELRARILGEQGATYQTKQEPPKEAGNKTARSTVQPSGSGLVNKLEGLEERSLDEH